MERQVGVREFRENLSSYIAEVQAGEPVTIMSRGKAVAQLNAVPPPSKRERRFGTLKGKIVFHEGWDTWTEEELAEFEKPFT